jgi:hypothetical protein
MPGTTLSGSSDLSSLKSRSLLREECAGNHKTDNAAKPCKTREVCTRLSMAATIPSHH